jgi:hypothetical protein
LIRIEARAGSPVQLTCRLNGDVIMSAEDNDSDRVNGSGTVGVVSRWTVDTSVPTGTPVISAWAGGSL